MECIKEDDRVRLLSRRGNDWTARFPAIVASARRLKPRRVILDGEAVALLEDGRSSFQALQQVLHTDPPGATVYYAFDLLRLEGEDLRGLPLEQRKARLARLLGPSRRRGTGALRYSEHTTGKVEAALTRACRKGLEGLIVKRRDLPYESGRTKSWLKVKCQNRQELVVIGFTEPKGRRSGIGALILGLRDDDGVLRYAGRVGTGMGDAMLASLRKQLEPLRRATSPAGRGVPRSQTGITWVEPKLVAEVSFTEWTSDGILRHPSFEGLREDKSPREVRREEPMQVSGIALSNADRVLYPEQGLTKLDLAAYYEAISPWMLPHVAGRPLSLVRCPGGRAKACFYQKHWSGHLPEALETVDIKEASGSTGSYSVVRDAAGLVSLVQYGVLEVHTWGARAERLRELLSEIGLESWLKTTGGKGLHVALPIARRSSWAEVSAFARAVAERLVADEPERYLSKASKAARAGKIFVDWLRNTRGATAIAPWSTRAREGASVSAPIPWKDLATLKSADGYTVENVSALVERLKRDPWGEMVRSKQRVTGAMVKKITG